MTERKGWFGGGGGGNSLEKLKQLQAQVADLHNQYAELEKAKDAVLDLFHAEATTTRSQIRSVIQQAQALKPKLEQLLAAGAKADEQETAIGDAAETEVTDIRSDIQDKTSDISAYASDWPGEMDELISDAEAYLADPDNFDDGKSAPALSTKAGAHGVYK